MDFKMDIIQITNKNKVYIYLNFLSLTHLFVNILVQY